MGTFADAMDSRPKVQDVVRRRREHKRDWNPAADTHRGRIHIVIVQVESREKQGVHLVLTQKPFKTDPDGESRL